ncbi:hypothetical protein HAX54_036955, partial [Datura stramonium]|nr:hypothetical protein [Datura stramonium]
MTDSDSKLTLKLLIDTTKAREGGRNCGVRAYMVMDDLVVKPMSGISSIALLNSFILGCWCLLQEKEVSFGMEE